MDIKDVAKEVFRDVSAAVLDVIRYEGDNSTFIWKHPSEDFYLGTSLDVHESQKAIFMFNGKIVEVFGPGRWIMTVEEAPFLKDIVKFVTKKDDVFHAEVYFVNETVRMSLHWGTPERIRFMDPATGAPIDIGAFGEMNLQVCDPCKLLTKLVGTTAGIAWETSVKDGKLMAQSLASAFRPMINLAVKTNLAKIIIENELDILEIDQHLETISSALRVEVARGFEEYGLTVPQFYVSNVALPDSSDPNFRIIKKLHTEKLHLADEKFEATMVAARRQVVQEQQETELEVARFEAEKKRIAAQAEADKRRLEGFADADVMAAKGYTEKDVLQAEVQKEYARGIGNMGGNSGGGGGGITSDMLGLGIGLAAMETVQKTMVDGMRGGFGGTPVSSAEAAPANRADTGWSCACGNTGNTGKFCSECGSAKPETWDCPACGAKGITGKFCSECGTAKPEPWDCPACGTKGNTGKFCSECGSAKGTTWDCPECGNKGITGKFCSECGHKKG